MKKLNDTSKKGFTLLEMMLTVAIMAIVLASVAAGINSYIDSANYAKEQDGVANDMYEQARLQINNILGDGSYSYDYGGGNPDFAGSPVPPAPLPGGGASPTAAPEPTTVPVPPADGGSGGTPSMTPSMGGGSSGGSILPDASSVTPTAAPTVAPTAAPTAAPSSGGSSGGSSVTTTIPPDLLGDGVPQSDGTILYGQNVKVDPTRLTKTGKGVNNIKVLPDGSYTLTLQNDQWNTLNCKIEINVGADGKITFTGGSGAGKYVLDGFPQELWKSDSFVLGQQEIDYLSKEYGVMIIA